MESVDPLAGRTELRRFAMLARRATDNLALPATDGSVRAAGFSDPEAVVMGAY